jgi:nucleoside phosphorylase
VVLLVAATEAELCGHPGLACGIGPVEAAAITAAALAHERPRALLHVGLAGARRGAGLRPPDLVIGLEAVYCDAAGIVASRVAPDPALVAAARSVIPDAPVLPIGTSARVGGSSGVDVEAMEGFAVLRAAELAGVPAVEVRAISNEIDERDRSRWRFDEALAALASVLPELHEGIHSSLPAE